MAKIILGSDHAGFELKDAVEAALLKAGHEVEDLGAHDDGSVDYPDFAHQVASRVQAGEGLGILVCGTGLGMAMAANRHLGVRAAVVSDTFSARMAREHNDANVLCIGSRVVGQGLALDLVNAFLGAEYAGGRHATRVGKIDPLVG